MHDVDGRPLEVSLIDGELRVGYQFTLGGWEGFLEKFRNFRDKDRADVSIAVPRDLPTKVGTVSAEGLLAGLQARGLGLDGLRLARRRRHPRHARRQHRLRRGRRARPPRRPHLNTVSGEVAASGALTRVQANTVSGELALDVTSGSSSIDATSVSGDVTVRLPQGEGVHVTANAVSGRLVVDGADHSRGGHARPQGRPDRRRRRAAACRRAPSPGT